MGSCQPDQRGDKDDPLAACQRGRHLCGLRGPGEQAQSLLQPAHGCPHAVHPTVQVVLDRIARRTGCQAGQEPVVGAAKGAPDVHDHERPGAVRDLEIAAAKTAVRKERCGLVHGGPGDRDAQPQKGSGVGFAQQAGRRPRIGEHPPRDAKECQERVLPVQGLNPKEHRPRGSRIVGHKQPPTAHPPHHPAVQRPHAQRSSLQGIVNGGYVLQQPLHLGGGKVGIEEQAGPSQEPIHIHGRLDLCASRRGPGALPGDHVVERFPGQGIPGDDRLALVCQTDGLDLLAAHGLLCRSQDRLPDVLGTHLYPAGMGIDLLQRTLRPGQERLLRVHEDRFCGGRSLIDAENVALQRGHPL